MEEAMTVIIDGRGTEDEGFWPACTYHGNRYGDGRVVPLVDIVAALRAAEIAAAASGEGE
jgi:hypothetical protein